MLTVDLDIPVSGPFDLDAALAFLGAWPAGAPRPVDGVLRYATSAEGTWAPVGVRVVEAPGGVRLRASSGGPVDEERLAGQVARSLSLDVDATGLGELAGRDRLARRLLQRHPGLRPVGFWSPWEAAVWALLVQRTQMRVASATKARLARELGTVVEVDGLPFAAFPAPDVVLEASHLPGVPAGRRDLLRGLAEAALDGILDGAALRAVPAAEALARLQRLPGIGPFSAQLVLVRGAGHPDVLATAEPMLLARLQAVYGLATDTPPATYHALGDPWRPYRSWIAFLLRATPDEELGGLLA